MQILQPAFVSRSGNGWTLVATGTLEVIKEQPKKKPVTQRPSVKPPPSHPPPPRSLNVKNPNPRGPGDRGEESSAWYQKRVLNADLRSKRSTPSAGSADTRWKTSASRVRYFLPQIDLDDELTIQHEATTTQLDSAAMDHCARTRTSFIEPRISFEAARDRWRRVRAVITRRVWFVPFRAADGFRNSRASASGFGAREPAATDGCDHDGSLAQCAR